MSQRNKTFRTFRSVCISLQYLDTWCTECDSNTWRINNDAPACATPDILVGPEDPKIHAQTFCFECFLSYIKYFKTLLQERIPETSKMPLCPLIHCRCLKQKTKPKQNKIKKQINKQTNPTKKKNPKQTQPKKQQILKAVAVVPFYECLL